MASVLRFTEWATIEIDFMIEDVSLPNICKSYAYQTLRSPLVMDTSLNNENLQELRVLLF
jgi:hypothetical protein